MNDQKNYAFDFRRTAVENVKEQRRKGFGQDKGADEANLGSILSGLKSIGEDMQQHYPRISEARFKARYLDAFAGYGESIEDNYAIYLEWVTEVAKQYNLPVHVCDNNDNRVVLFTVPPVTNVTTINPEKARNEEIQSAVITATEMRHMQPYAWQAVLTENLKGVFQKVYDKSNVVSPQQQVWLDIFNRYEEHFKGRQRLDGLNPQLMVENTNATSNGKPTPPPEADYPEVEEEC